MECPALGERQASSISNVTGSPATFFSWDSFDWDGADSISSLSNHAHFQVGITSARPGKSKREVVREMGDFRNSLLATGVQDASVEAGRGGWEGGHETTYVTQFQGDNTALRESVRAIAAFGKEHNQDAVLIQRYVRADHPKAQPQSRIVFGAPLDEREMGLLETMLAQHGVGGWTWVNKDGQTTLMATCIPQWGGDKKKHRRSMAQVAGMLEAAGYDVHEQEAHVLPMVIQRGEYDEYMQI